MRDLGSVPGKDGGGRKKGAGAFLSLGAES